MKSHLAEALLATDGCRGNKHHLSSRIGVQEVTHAPVHGPTPMNIPAPLSEFRKRTREVGRKKVACGVGKEEGMGFTKTHYMNVLIFQ